MSERQVAVSYDDIVAAAKRLQGVTHRTCVMTSSQLNDLTGAEVFFKCENFQHVGAFKFRGAYNAISQLDATQKKCGVVAFSSGNHAQAMAKAARILGVSATIVMPEDAPAIKISATYSYGAHIVTYNRFLESREVIAATLATEKGLTILPSIIPM